MTIDTSKPKYSSKQPRNDLTADYVRSVINYDPVLGIIWHKPRTLRPGLEKFDKIWNKRFAVPKLKPCKNKGYLHIKIDGASYRAHRIAWVHYYGEWPKSIIDHKNGIRDDLRIDNLREATFSRNGMNSARRSNNQSGLKGVDFMAKKGMWRARVGISGKNIFLGTYSTPEAAYAAYCEAAARLHGNFARFN